MRKKRKPHEERKPEDYMEAADNALELAKVLAGEGGTQAALGEEQVLQAVGEGEESGA